MKRLAKGLYEDFVFVRLTLPVVPGKPVTVTSSVLCRLVVEYVARGDRIDGEHAWRWELHSENMNFHQQDEDGGYPTKAEIVAAFSEESKPLRNWQKLPSLGWCLA